ncbi:MAG: hypothetical protein HYW15_01445 [Candidatus Giovannonibacteria bacterium]|nr:MAG: hypothetical protein HYW15_01445 [Candidatus Giovannonibacteria bacterium]
MNALSKPLFLILTFALLTRIAGVAYGLPLWLVDDEPPFVLASLKMLELKTLLPALHPADFKTVLYYPPYFSYLYLPFFAALVGIKFLFYSGPAALFASYLLTDLSQFFIIARAINLMLGAASVFLIYKITESIFQSSRAALFAAFFVSTSLIHIALSMVSRHWLSVFFFTALVLFWLSRPALPNKTRYLLAVFSAGLGVGFAIINAVLILLIAFWCLLYEKKHWLNLLKDKFFYKLYALFAGLAALPYLLYPGSLGFRADVTTESAKTLWGALASPVFFAKTAAFSEPILILFAVLGLGFALWRARNVFWTFFIFIYSYSVIFYLIFRFEPRFFMGILPLFIILAGYGFYEIQKRISSAALSKLFMLLLLLPLIFVLQLGRLALKNDSRALARSWAEKNLRAGTKIITLARLTRLPTNKEAAREQKIIDPASLRKVDLADAELGEKNFHALNLFDANNQNFYENLENYAKENNYEYVIIQPNYRNGQYFQSMLEKGEELAAFGGGQTKLSLAESQFLANPLDLFKLKELGPEIKIYKINR